MSAQPSIYSGILKQHAGRDPERLAMKLQLIAGDPFDFFRGTAELFYQTLPVNALLRDAPRVLTCGDLHLENFGTFRGGNRLVYFDLNDFDEACIAPLTMELVRFLASVYAGAKSLKLADERADHLCELFLARYAATLAQGKPAWLERSTSRGMVKQLLVSLKKRRRNTLLNQRTRLRKNGERALLVDGVKILEVRREEREHVRSCLKAYAAKQPHPDFYQPLDIGRRVAGNGSLGLPRYIVLIEGHGEPDGHVLLDLKAANPSALAPHVPGKQPRWHSEGERVVAIQQVMQAMSPALLAGVSLHGVSFMLKELQPSTDKLDLEGARGRLISLTEVIEDMAHLTAWAQLRGGGRFGAALPDELMKFGARRDWQQDLMRTARAAAECNHSQWREYRDAYRAAHGEAAGTESKAGKSAAGVKPARSASVAKPTESAARAKPAKSKKESEPDAKSKFKGKARSKLKDMAKDQAKSKPKAKARRGRG